MSKNILFILFAVILLGGGIYLFANRNTTPTDSALAGDTSDADIAKIRADLGQLEQIKNLTLDTAIFDDPLFQSLRQPNQNPTPVVSSGRRNPFAPFSGR